EPQPVHSCTCTRVVCLDRGTGPDHEVPGDGVAMATCGGAIRCTRVGAVPVGEHDHGYHADRGAISYWAVLGNETVLYFAANVRDYEIPETIDGPHSGLLAGRDKDNPPAVNKPEPYKTHLAYVKERRTDEEAATLLDDALLQLRE